jgi:hypothetical protein
MIQNYEVLSNGVIKQSTILKKKEYNNEYVNYYNTLGEIGMQMGFLRLGFLLGAMGSVPNKLLDVGYGNGDFLKAARTIIPQCYGSDVSGFPVPENITFIEDIYSKEFDVVCFFDVLEHFEDIYEITNLKTKYIYVSLPYCHNFSDEWFTNWKHRKPDEHLYHFNEQSLINFMSEIGYKVIKTSNIEDAIRKPVDAHQNILSALFVKE